MSTRVDVAACATFFSVWSLAAGNPPPSCGEPSFRPVCSSCATRFRVQPASVPSAPCCGEFERIAVVPAASPCACACACAVPSDAPCACACAACSACSASPTMPRRKTRTRPSNSPSTLTVCAKLRQNVCSPSCGCSWLLKPPPCAGGESSSAASAASSSSAGEGSPCPASTGPSSRGVDAPEPWLLCSSSIRSERCHAAAGRRR
eukprot:7391607-Prymnesium_polylepis.3